MISAKIRNPESKLEFMEFIHGTTCIVAVPHGAQSELWVSSDQQCTLVIEAAGRELEVLRINAPGSSVKLSDLLQPLVRNTGGGLVDLFSFGPFRRQHSAKPTQRLYNFRAIVESGSPQNRGEVLATFDFHLLCEVDFHWARAYHLELNGDRSQATGSIAERAEGSCPHCQEVRTRLERDWRYDA